MLEELNNLIKRKKIDENIVPVIPKFYKGVQVGRTFAKLNAILKIYQMHAES